MVTSTSDPKNSAHMIPLSLRDDMCKSTYKPGGKYLNLGCGKEYYTEDGWVNLDGDPKIKADVHHDLEIHPLPFEDNTFDCVFASHVFEHVHDIQGLKQELRRIMKPNAELIVIVPCYLFADAWGDPTHYRAFSEASFVTTFWPGYTAGHAGHLPTMNNYDMEGNPKEEYWLWTKKAVLKDVDGAVNTL